jgi:uroporphyrinogen decarboxylase
MGVLKNDRLIRALLRQPVDYTPVWLMRQAGRYLPEYRALRSRVPDFMQLCKTPELACEVTLQPLQRFNFDAAILFSDILTIPDAMGLGLHFNIGEGPVIERPIRSESDIKRIHMPDPGNELRYVCDAVRLIKNELHHEIPLIGFAGSPWTLATYMIEGGSSKSFSHIKGLLYSNPALLHHLLELLSHSVTGYLNAQIAAGVDAVMIFDTWGGVLTTKAYQNFSLNYMSSIIQGLTKEREGQPIPIILFTKNGGQWVERMAETGCNAVGIDWTVNLSDIRNRVGNTVAIQGNLDPAILLGTPEYIRKEVKEILESYGHGSGHVFNLGHGILPEVPFENVKVLVDAVHEFSIHYHKQ